jgi:hypothetical protein
MLLKPTASELSLKSSSGAGKLSSYEGKIPLSIRQNQIALRLQGSI